VDNIVVGIDETPASQAALEWVAGRCVRRPTRVKLVNVVSRPRDADESMDLLTAAESTLRARVPGQAVELQHPQGSTVRALTALAAGADLLVVGVDPNHPVKAALSGWLPLRVVARSTVPVCIVPTGWDGRAGDITVGLADDGTSDEALVFAAREAIARATRLHVVHVWRDAEFPSDGPTALVTDPRTVIEQHRHVLDEKVRALVERFPALDVESDLVRASPEAALVEGADHSELIVIGTHHQGVLFGSFSGSIAQDIVGRSRCPVCIVPPMPSE